MQFREGVMLSIIVVLIGALATLWLYGAIHHIEGNQMVDRSQLVQELQLLDQRLRKAEGRLFPPKDE